MNKTLGASGRYSWYPCPLPTEAKNDVNDDKDDGDEGGPWRPWVTLLKYRRICFASPSAAVQEGGGVARELTSGASPTRMHQHVFLWWSSVMLFVWRAWVFFIVNVNIVCHNLNISDMFACFQWSSTFTDYIIPFMSLIALKIRRKKSNLQWLNVDRFNSRYHKRQAQRVHFKAVPGGKVLVVALGWYMGGVICSCPTVLARTQPHQQNESADFWRMHTTILLNMVH